MTSALSSLTPKGWVMWSHQHILVQLHTSDPASKNRAQDLITTRLFIPRKNPCFLLTREERLLSRKEFPLQKTKFHLLASSVVIVSTSPKWPPWEELAFFGRQSKHASCQLTCWVKGEVSVGLERDQLL